MKMQQPSVNPKTVRCSNMNWRCAMRRNIEIELENNWNWPAVVVYTQRLIYCLVRALLERSSPYVCITLTFQFRNGRFKVRITYSASVTVVGHTNATTCIPVHYLSLFFVKTNMSSGIGWFL